MKKIYAIWAGFSLRFRISFFLVVLFASASGFQILRFRSFFISDKIAYLSETRNLKSETAASVLALALKTQIQNFKSQQALKIKTGQTDLIELQRLPEKNEIFVESVGARNKRALFRMDDGQVRSTPLDFAQILNSFVIFSESRGLLATNEGRLLAYFGMSESSATNEASQRMKVLLDQKVAQIQTSQVNSLGQDWLIGLQEIIDTNVVLYTEVPLDDLLAPLYKTLRDQLGLSLAALVFMLVMVQIVMGALTQPLKSLVLMFRSIGTGNQNSATRWPSLLPEFEPIKQAVERMNFDLNLRQHEIQQINQALAHVLQMSESVAGLGNGSRMELLIWLAPQVNIFVNSYFKRLLDRPLYIVTIADQGAKSETLVWFLEPKHELCKLADTGLLNVKSVFGQNFIEKIRVHFQAEAHTSWVPNSAHSTLEAINPLATKTAILRIGSDEFHREMFLIFANANLLFTSTESHLISLFCKSIHKVLERFYLDEVTLLNQKSLIEVSAAKEIQRASLIFPKCDLPVGIVLDSFYAPSDLVGGDWYGVFFHPEINTLNLYLGDVSGHGLSSAFLGCLASGAIQAEELKLGSLGSNFDMGLHFNTVACHLNTIIASGGKDKKGMTMCMCSVNLVSGKVIVLNAGHPPALVLSSDRMSLAPLLCPPSSVFGMDEEPKFTIAEFDLKDRESLLIYTDGFVEGHERKRNKKLGNSGFRKLILAHTTALLQNENAELSISKAIAKGFYDLADADDDLAMISLTLNKKLG